MITKSTESIPGSTRITEFNRFVEFDGLII